MDARDDAWFGGPGEDLAMPVLRELAANEIRRVPAAGEIWEHPEREFGVLYPG
jgi:hypothetical protein